MSSLLLCETNIMWMICLFAAGYRASSSLALKFQLLTSRSCFGNGGACIVDLIIHYWPDMVIEKHYKPRSYSTIFHRWWRWSLFILLAYRWKEPFDLNVIFWYQPLLLIKACKDWMCCSHLDDTEAAWQGSHAAPDLSVPAWPCCGRDWGLWPWSWRQASSFRCCRSGL